MSFNHPEFLYALLAVLIPVIIHLFNFRRYKKLWFSNIQFLKNITTETRRQNRLKHLVILLLRILAIVFIVLAFAGPQFNSEERKSLSAESLAVVYVDNSFSMLSEGENGRLFEQSLNRAREIAVQMPRDKQFVFITNQRESGRKLFSKEAFNTTLDQASVTADSRKLSSVIRSAIKIRDEKGFAAADIYLLSDFQSNVFDYGQFPSDSLGYYYFMPIELLMERNIYIDSCWITDPVILPGKAIQLKIRVANDSENDLKKIPLKVSVGGQQKAVAGVDLKTGSRETVTVNFTLYNKGWHSGMVEIEDHPIVFDDKLYISFKVQEQINVLAIGKDQNQNLLRSFYETEPLFNFVTMDYRQIDYSLFNEFNLIILNALPEISTGLSSQIRDFVVAGNNLLFIPDPVEGSPGNNLLVALQAGSMTAVDTSETRVVRINRQSEMFREAIKKIPDNADLPTVFSHVTYKYNLSDGLVSLVNLLNGDDFLLKKNLGSGLAYFLAVPLDRAYSNFTSNALFVPVMYNAAVQGNSTKRLFYIIGNDNLVEAEIVKLPSGDRPFEFRQDETGFSMIPEQRISNGRLIMDLHNGLSEDGIYSLVLADSTYSLFAFNYNRDESRMDFLNGDTINELVRSSDLKRFEVVNTGKAGMLDEMKSLQKEDEIWKLFIIFALLMLLAEILILRLWK